MGLGTYSGGQEPRPRDVLANGGFDADANDDGWPDAWFDYHHARITNGGRDGSQCLELSCADPFLEARCQQGFPIDGNTISWVEIAAWAASEGCRPGETDADVPAIRISLFNANEEVVWTEAVRLPLPAFGWRRFARTVKVPAEATHGLFTATLGGATGTVRVDDASIAAIPGPYAGGRELLLNPSFEWGGGLPDHWRAFGVERIGPGRSGQSALSISHGWVEQEVLLPESADRLRLRAWVRSETEAGVFAHLAFYDEWGRPRPDARGGMVSCETVGDRDWVGWEGDRIGIPDWAAMVIVRCECVEGRCEVDDLSLHALDEAGEPVLRAPLHAPDTDDWPVYPAHEPDVAAADRAIKLAPIRVQDGDFVTPDGRRARFWGLELCGADCFLTEEQVLSLCRHLRARGFNLVVFRDMCWPSSVGHSLVPPYGPDTRPLHEPALGRLDYLCALLARNGIYYAFEVGGGRRFREGDGVAAHRELPAGGGPAAFYDPGLVELQKRHAAALLGHRNAVTGRPYADDPALAWVSVTAAEPPLGLADPLHRTPMPPEPYASDLERRLREWLLARYGSARNWPEVWQTAMPEGAFAGLVTEAGLASEARMRDTTAFLHDLQVQFAEEMTSAVRETGFAGPVSSGLQYLSLPADLASKARSGLVELLAGDLPRPAAGPFVSSSLCFPGQDAASLAAVREVEGCPTVVVDAGATSPAEAANALLLLSAVGGALDWDGLIAARVAPVISPWGSQSLASALAHSPRGQRIPANSHPLLVELLPVARGCFLRGHRLPETQRPASPMAIAEARPLDAVGLHALPTAEALRSPARLSFRAEAAALHPPFRPARRGKSIVLGDLSWDWARGRWTVQGETVAILGGMVKGALLPVRPFLVRIESEFGIFAAVSEDGAPLAESRRMRLSLLGWGDQPGALYADGALRNVIGPGRSPMRLAPLQARVSLPGEAAGTDLHAFRLAWQGERAESLEVTRTARGFALELPAQGHYELTVD